MVEVEEVDGKLLFPLLELELVEENRELEVEGKVEEREEELVWGGAKEAEGGFRVTVRMALVEGGNDGLKIGMKFCC